MEMNMYSRVGHEAISVQLDDKEFTEEASAVFDKLLDKYATYKPMKSSVFMNRKDVKDMLADLDRIVMRRFGIAVKHISGDNMGYAITPIQPLPVNVLAGDINEKIEMLEKEVEGHSPNTKHDVTDFNRNRKDVYSGILQSHHQLSKAMNTDGVVIDEQNARVRGLPSEIDIYAILDLKFFDKQKATGEEVCATMLHEVGHVFTHLSESYRSVRLTETFIEALSEMKDQPDNRKYRILNKKMFGGARVIGEEDGPMVAYIKFQRGVMNQLLNMHPTDTEVSVESERMADQFVVRFGMGKHLATILDKFNRSQNVSFYKVGVLELKIMLLGFIFIGPMATLTFMATVIVYITLGSAFFILAIAMTIGGEKNNDKTYDGNYRRLQRVQTDELRLLRLFESNKLPQPLIDEKVATVRMITNMLKKMPKQDVYTAIADYMPWFSKSIKSTQIDRELELGMDNMLHMSKHLLKTIENE